MNLPDESEELIKQLERYPLSEKKSIHFDNTFIENVCYNRWYIIPQHKLAYFQLWNKLKCRPSKLAELFYL